MIVIPGGRDLPFVRDLDDSGVSLRLAKWIRSGGKYIGLCAGGYFASKQVVFEPHRSLQVVGERRMKLFLGQARGCCFPGFVYESEQGARAVGVNVDGRRVYTYYNGGCTFLPDAEEKCDVLATYADPMDFEMSQEFPQLHLENAPAAIMTYPGKGQALLSGVHVEYDGQLMSSTDNDPQMIQMLQKTDPLRRQVFKTWLARMGLRVADEDSLLPPPHSTLHVYGAELRKEWKDDLYDFVTNPTTPPIQHDERLIVSISPETHSVPGWDTLQYFGLLTGRIGKCFMYAHTLPSTQTLLEKNGQLFKALPEGSVCVATRQTGGRGRGRNSWVGLEGCLQFSMTLRYPRLHGSVVLIQYLTAVAVTQGITDICPSLNVKIKWPNDVYCVDGMQKLSGILVNSSYEMTTNEFLLVVGCGINVANAHPTTCLHSLLEAQGKQEPYPTLEQVLAVVLNKFDSIYTQFLKTGWKGVVDVYESLWLHDKQRVGVEQEGKVIQAIIHGINQDGYLDCRGDDGQVLLLGPDGNGFDMMKGLIVQKHQ
jgi:biotin--protein ligase